MPSIFPDTINNSTSADSVSYTPKSFREEVNIDKASLQKTSGIMQRRVGPMISVISPHRSHSLAVGRVPRGIVGRIHTLYRKKDRDWLKLVQDGGQDDGSSASMFVISQSGDSKQR